MQKEEMKRHFKIRGRSFYWSCARGSLVGAVSRSRPLLTLPLSRANVFSRENHSARRCLVSLCLQFSLGVRPLAFLMCKSAPRRTKTHAVSISDAKKIGVFHDRSQKFNSAPALIRTFTIVSFFLRVDAVGFTTTAK